MKRSEEEEYELELGRIKALDQKLITELGGTKVMEKYWGEEHFVNDVSNTPTKHNPQKYSRNFPTKPAEQRRHPQLSSKTPRLNTRRKPFITFRPEECREIDRNNLMLVRRLASIALRKHPTTKEKKKQKKVGNRKPNGPTSITMNRTRIQQDIDRENRLIAERLARVQGTKSLSVKVLRHDAKMQKKYASQCSMKQRRLQDLHPGKVKI